MLIDQVKVGDILITQGDGYLSDMIRKYTVIRVTKTQIICKTVSNKTAEFKFNRRGVLLPQDRFINHRVIKINDTVINPYE